MLSLFYRDNEDVEPLPLNAILPKLYEVSVKSSNDNEKVKCNAVRAIGTILLLCQENQETRIHKDTSMGLEALIKCATVGKDMKVRFSGNKNFVNAFDEFCFLIINNRFKGQMECLSCHRIGFK